MENQYIKFCNDCPVEGFTADKEYRVKGSVGQIVFVIDDNNHLVDIHSTYFTSPPYTKEEEKQTIFTYPKWVTAKETDLEVGLVADKDYVVTKVEGDRYWVENLFQSNAPVWYKKERFYKVTPEDLLPPKKKSVEHIDEGFENLIYKEPHLNDCYIKLNLLSEEQLTFITGWEYRDKGWFFDVKNDKYFIFCKNDKDWYFSRVKGTILITFNDIFKHAEEK